MNNERGMTPTYREIRDAMKMEAHSAAFRLVQHIKEKGYVKLNPHRIRAIEIIKLPEDLQGCNQCRKLQEQLDEARKQLRQYERKQFEGEER
jgi:SOS-response transcriptional repressor LexA